MNNKSIAKKLSRKLFFRLYWTFFALNVAICVLVSVGVFVRLELHIRDTVRSIEKGVITTENIDEIFGDSHLAAGIITARVAPDGVRTRDDYFHLYSRALPDSTRGFDRYIELSTTYLRVSEYVYVPVGDELIEVRVSTDVRSGTILLGAFGLLLAFELLLLIIKSSKNTYLVHRSLDPITELTRAAESLGRVKPENLIPINVGAALDKGDIKQLRGALETINAARLDTRLDVGGTQRELRELAAAINGMLDRINDAYEAQVRFVSDASHELRTPIAVIQGYASLLDRWGKTDEKTLQEGIDAIRAEADSMKELVEQLLFLARGENRTITPELTQFDLAELAAEIADEATLINTTHEFRLVADAALVSADRGLIKQAARVLLDNAIKYTDANGVITLKTTTLGDTATLSVTDTGIGIDEELLPRIFDRFVRADESRTRASGGAGLGLSIAKWIVSNHGGHLDALSRAGVGTRITIVLPTASQGNHAAKSGASDAVASGGASETVQSGDAYTAPVLTDAPVPEEIKLTFGDRDA